MAPSVAIAFILVTCAGLCTAIGASAVFFPKLANLANRKTLAGSLGLAAGVMLYVGLVDIYTKAIGGFEEVHDEGKSFIYATLSFFGGCFLMLFLNWLVKRILGGQDVEEVIMEMAMESHNYEKGEEHADMSDPVAQLQGIQRMARDVNTRQTNAQDIEVAPRYATNDDNEEFDDESVNKKPQYGTEVSNDSAEKEHADANNHKLRKMGFAMALAIAIHNFPEGLVTFAAYVEDPAVGIALAIGIGIHNIPEGLCVSMPIYYATGRRWYAFMWGVLSGLSEPLGALVGWGIFNSNFGGNAYGIMFGIVSGMMTMIAVDELMPTAARYDPKNEVTTYSFLVGAFMIALSLMLFST